MGIYTAPYVLAYKVNGATLNTYLSLSPGTYYTVVQEWDNCGGATKTPITITVTGSTSVPASKHIWIITEENHSYESVIGNPKMPYFNSLASNFGLASQYYSNQHSSLPALMWLVAGQSVTSNNYTTSCFNVDNVVRHLLLKGFTWRAYEEDLPYAGFTGLSWANYVRRHNPLIDFTDVCTPSQHLNSVPFTQLAKDTTNHATPNYGYITPNLQHDADLGSLAQADSWLSQQVPTILALPEFQSTGDGILFIVWDEGSSTDDRCSASLSTGCGGRVATLVIGPKVRRGHKSTVLYHHQNLLRTVCSAMGFATCPGAGSSATPMSDLF
jgi:Phosphoesterase family